MLGGGTCRLLLYAFLWLERTGVTGATSDELPCETRGALPTRLNIWIRSQIMWCCQASHV